MAQGDAEREFSSMVHRALSGAVMTETYDDDDDGGAGQGCRRGSRRGADGGAEGGADGPAAPRPGARGGAAAEAGVTLAYMCRLGEASRVVATGTWDGESLDDAVQLAASGCARVDGAEGGRCGAPSRREDPVGEDTVGDEEPLLNS